MKLARADRPQVRSNKGKELTVNKIWLLAGVTLAVALSAAAAVASSTPRLTGQFRVRVTVTAAKNIGQHKGDTGVVKWSFKPKCAAGACNTTFKRRTLGKTTSTELLKPAEGSYREALSTVVECVRGKTVLAKKGYHAKLAITVKPTTLANGVVTAFSGTGVVSDTPTGTARAKNCPSASERFKFTSL